ncbi:hypothetical protein C8R48DRAFT_833024 [Suillus tomentosus]|nr:hypothetical protein C8R48DRAFT_833024 [Suillus tomentosus]
MRGASKSHPHPSNPGLTRHDIILQPIPESLQILQFRSRPLVLRKELRGISRNWDSNSWKNDGYSRVTVLVDEADVLFESTRMLLGDITAARSSPFPVVPSSALSSTLDSEATTTTISYPFNFLLTSATISTSLATYLSNYYPSLTRLASPRLHHFPPTLRTEHTS